MFENLVKKNRSYRRFFENEELCRETLVKLINYARLSPCGANRQMLRYYIACDKQLNQKVYPGLRWAGYLKDWDGPQEGERPSGYIAIVREEQVNKVHTVDYGIAAQSILLGAVELGLGGCMIGNFDQAVIREALQIPENYEVLLVIALGKPQETVVMEEIDLDGDIKYWRDEQQIHHVPKRKLADIIMN
ncbi:nitroreductase family protein [Sporomusa acidovorans]|uniref:Nitroreductase domain-containing protein n=1 Tax=Sporomusa acidovorans (strain ATCC 49682 / DSM 3132 / Mol) TaxID=1123286 RepID=A0ABZ3IZX3_SPOA4|nr:nitroreductase family protein [Sporomusa acidovorans]OZC18336.1 coenzyme F420:L-glutamate ligase [Sporomusa acidovorans DSM 3132]SDF19653.1 Nitroreductase [Sporomusa acidovorans]